MSSTHRSYLITCCRHGKPCNESTTSLTSATTKSSTRNSSKYSRKSRKNTDHRSTTESYYSRKDDDENASRSPSDENSLDYTTSYATVDEEMPVIDAPMDPNGECFLVEFCF